jgi:drug/metabolite transporter (DMT)-like permease
MYAALLLAAAIWGLGFVATAKTLESFHPLWSNAARFVLAAPVGLLIFRRRVVLDRAHLLAAASASVLLAATFTFQTWGLAHTSVARSSLITGLYAIFTPLVAPVFRAPAPRVMHFVGATLALAGLWLLSGGWDDAAQGFNVGDLLTLGCALVSAAHIHVVGRVAPGRDPFALNALQMAFVAVWSLLAAGASGVPLPVQVSGLALAALVFLALFSSVLAFGIQMMAQQRVSPSTAATLFLLETPFGVLFGALLLAERLGWVQAVGGGLMLAGCLVSVRADAVTRTA